jgi:hypothetical protein
MLSLKDVMRLGLTDEIRHHLHFSLPNDALKLHTLNRDGWMGDKESGLPISSICVD